MKRLLSVILLLAATAMQAVAEDWPLKIAGIQVTDDNCEDVKGESITALNPEFESKVVASKETDMYLGDIYTIELYNAKIMSADGEIGIDGDAKSAARVVYDYYGGKEALPRISDELMAAVDKGDSADFTVDEILDPQGWVLLNFIMDARTGLGRFHDFRISNYDLMMELIDYCLTHPIEDILQLPDVRERTDLYFEQQELFKKQLTRIAKIHDKVVVIDLRNEDTIYAGNRFMIYAMHPEVEMSVHVAWGFRKQNTAVMIGKSIVNKNSKVNIGELCLTYGGGGHANAGTCQLDNDKVDGALPDIIAALNGK